MVGYKHECFNYLVDKYGVQLIVSAQYATANNYSSLQLVAHRLGDSLVIDGDTYIRRPVVPLVRPGVSQFICQQTQQGREWELITDAGDRVVAVRKDSPSGYCMSGVSYWTEEPRPSSARNWTRAARTITGRMPSSASWTACPSTPPG